MSHDRGCWKCNEDPSEYARCPRAQCPKHHAVEIARPTTGIEDAIKKAREHLVRASRPVCNSCGREQPLWGNCFRLASECPVRAAFAPGRPATRIISVSEPGYDILFFNFGNGGAQAIISRPGGKDPIDILIAPPIPGRQIVIERKGDMFEVFYKDAQS